MKRIFYFLSILSICASVATACASKTAAGVSSTVTADNGSSSALGNSPDSMSRLAIGTILLEDGELAVQPEQAAQLLPLWQVYQNLVNSDTAAQAEIDALIKQIENTMLPEQVAAIQDMQINDESTREAFERLGLSRGFGGQKGAQGTPQAETSQMPFQRGEGGDMPQGVTPGGRPGFGGMAPEGMPEMQGQPDPALQATLQAQKASRQNKGINPMLLNALIELLQGKVPANS